MATIQELEQALIRADAAGDMDAARKLAAAVKQARQDPVNQIPGSQVPGTTAQTPEPSIGQQILGAGETALTMATGATTGAVGMIGGAIRGIGQSIVYDKFGTPEGVKMAQDSAAQGAQALTYSPRTQAGQQQVQAVGELMQDVIPPVLPMMASPGNITNAIKASAPMAALGAQRAAAPVARAVQNVAARMPGQAQESSAFGKGSMGAAQVGDATLRQSKANELPVPIPLTKGQKTRTFEQQRFERETAKDPELGAPIRERMALQQNKMRQNLETFVDATGAETADLRSTGIVVNDALRSMVAQAKARERVLYREAEKAGELMAPVDMQPLADYLNANRAGRQSAPILGTIAESIMVQEVGKGSMANGTLTAGAATLKQAEEIRKAVNRFVKSNDPNDVRIGTEIKSVIDDITEGVGGEKYKQARSARAQRARDFENVTLVSNLLGTKRGSSDRSIALEDVARKAIIEPSTSLDQTRHLGLLLKKTPQGQQAWKELQGATVRYIRDEAYKGVTTDQTGNRVISPAQLDRAITNLDKSGKLDYVFGKKGAEQLRILNDVAKDVFTAPPGVVNTSNTASVLMTALDTMGTFGLTGVPVPAMQALRAAQKMRKDSVTKKQVREALGETQ